jgi:hypothetical protein
MNRGRGAERNGNFQTAVEAYLAALDLWRGPIPEVSGGPVVTEFVRWSEETRMECRDCLISSGLAYVLVAISALVHFGRTRWLHVGVAVSAVLATVSIGFVAWNVFTSYDHSLLYAFAIALAAGSAWFAFVWVTRREQAARVGTFAVAASPASEPAPGRGLRVRGACRRPSAARRAGGRRCASASAS